MNRQDRRANRARIVLEGLESRVVLSTVVALEAVIHGSTSTVVGDPDVGTTVMLSGSGIVQGVGSVRTSGTLNGTGFFASSHVDGTLKLTHGKGSVTLQLQSPNAVGFTAPKSGVYDFSFSKGTGPFAHEVGSGTIDLALGSRSFVLNIVGKPDGS